MAHALHHRLAQGAAAPALVRDVPVTAPLAWLRAGWRDLRRAQATGLSLGLLVALAGWVLLLAFNGAPHAAPALLGGFLLVAPFGAIVLYEISAQIEDGELLETRLAWHAWQRNGGAIGMLGLAQALVLVAWERLSAMIFALFLGDRVPAAGHLWRELLFSGRYTPLLLAFLGTGVLLAALVFAFSVVSAPMLMDEPVDAVTAMLTSWRCCAANPAAMVVWAGLIAALTLVGMATLMLGLVVIFPWLGHASWHAYRDLVEVDPVTENR